ncbi:lytic transglycosylase domain-containing protein [Bradyrhizobium zhanjiangense]|uniref:lytic transglycosylase domain-containing protein n=1 Tax=Bradyrhizobium zhanjiangense TaxID=1325107 RepID=UPI001008734D|nr:lytic transglycosylase domain-containing protein [Bradyrhizobium zhanjiangense]
MGHPLEYTPFPTTNPSVGATGARERITVDPGMFGGGIAQGLGTFGAGLEKAANTGLQIATEHQEKQNEVHAAEVGTWLADRVTDRHAAYAILEGKAALDALPQYKQDLGDLYKQAMEQAPSESERVMVAKSAKFLTSRYYGYAAEHAARQSRAWADKTAIDRAASNANLASIANQNSDPQGMEVALRGSDDEVRKLFEQKGYDAEAVEAEVAKNRGRNLQRIIKETASYDSDAAVKLFVQYAPQMDGQSRADTGAYLKPIRIQQNGKQIGDEALGQSPLPTTLNDEVDRAASIAGLDPALLRGVIRIESSGNPTAVKGSYKGLGQLSDDQFQKYGGGDIFNARDNLRATARKLADEAGEFEQKYGRLPTAAEMYLTHQQGAGGYAAHMANPDRPAWQNMLSTKEGQQKGEAWAKAAIWGNIPDRDKARFGSVENVTSRQFTQLWEQKVDVATGRALPDKSEAFSRARDLLQRGNAGPALEAATLTYLGRRYSHQEAETALETQQVEGLVKSDLTSMLTTGRGVDDLNPYRVQRALGTAAAQKWAEDRDDALATWSATHDLPSLTDTQIDERLASIAPKPGDVDFDRKQAVYTKASKAAAKLRKQRDIDPAETVRTDPLVKAAETAPDGSRSVRAIVEARLAAQTRAGIPKENQSPITHAEAITLTRPLRTMLPGQERDVVTAMATKFQDMYGEHADQAFAYALRAHKVDNEVAQFAARLVRKLGLGQLPDESDARVTSATAEIGAAERAISAATPFDPSYSVPGYGMGPMQAAAPRPRAEGVTIPTRAIMDLRANPRLADDFDRKYGAGEAKKILDNYPVR